MIVTTGPVGIRYDDKLRTALPQDAIYYLDYVGGRLLATVPSFQQKGGSTRLLDTFAERDLVADFKLDPVVGPKPHFLMTTGSLGQYSLGWAPSVRLRDHDEPGRQLQGPAAERRDNHDTELRADRSPGAACREPGNDALTVYFIGGGPRLPRPRDRQPWDRRGWSSPPRGLQVQPREPGQLPAAGAAASPPSSLNSEPEPTG